MDILDARGLHKVEEKKANIERIRRWFFENPGRTKKDCSNALGLCYKTIIDHVKEIESEETTK